MNSVRDEAMAYVRLKYGALSDRELCIALASAGAAYRWTLLEVSKDITDKVSLLPRLSVVERSQQ